MLKSYFSFNFRLKLFTEECSNIFRSIFHQVLDEREKSGIQRNDLINILISLKNKKLDDNGILSELYFFTFITNR